MLEVDAAALALEVAPDPVVRVVFKVLEAAAVVTPTVPLPHDASAANERHKPMAQTPRRFMRFIHEVLMTISYERAQLR